MEVEDSTMEAEDRTLQLWQADKADIVFYINGEKQRVTDKFPATATLNDYIRDVAGLTGTKMMCKQAGCGCCAVTVTNALDGEKLETMSINSCLCPLYSVDGWQITTTEGIGSEKKGLHPIQKRLAEYNGTQCGYCSPGFVMSMYGLLHQDPKPTMTEIEGSLDGHICRCTGYRSILDAMKTFGSDSPSGGTIDIEDLNKNLCPKTGAPCTNPGDDPKKPLCSKSPKNKVQDSNGVSPTSLAIELEESRWYRPLTLKNLGEILQQHKTHTVKMVFGNTAAGIFEDLWGPYEVYIDIRSVKDLHFIKDKKTSLVFGGATTIGQFRKKLIEIGDSRAGFHYFPRVVRHLNVLASVLVRNAGSMAGNLMIKHANPWFPSDLFTMLEAIGASVEIYDSHWKKTCKYSMMDFLRKVDMKNKVIFSIELPSWKPHDHFRSFKITPRWQNAHAYINAAFKIPVKDRKIVGRPNIVVGGVNAETVHAVKTEAFLENKTLDDAVVNGALKVMFGEINPETLEVGGSPQYRKQLSVNLLYKTLLEVYQPMKFSLQSGALSLERPLSSGIQTYQEMKDRLPVGASLPKKTVPFQVSGEAKYTGDMHHLHNELQAVLVKTTIAKGKIDKIDTSAALEIPGVVGFVGAADIPKGGQNNIIPMIYFMFGGPTELFVTSDIEFAGAFVGVILAETLSAAELGAKAVKITYKDVQKPVLDIKEAVEKKLFHPEPTSTVCHERGNVEDGLKNAAFTIEGECEMGQQYQFFIEPQTALCVPNEDGMDVYTATQGPDMVQRATSQILGKPMNYFNVTTARLGGAFGGKMLTAAGIAGAAAVAAETTGRPVRLVSDLSTNMQYTSKRWPFYTKYRAGCDANGKLVALDLDIYVDSGHTPCITSELVSNSECAYFSPNYRLKFQKCKTNKIFPGAVRGPCSVPASMMMETVLEHLAHKAKQDPIMFREINLMETGQKDIEGNVMERVTIKKCWDKLKETAEVKTRQEDVARYNKNNLWRKRGLAMTAVKYDMTYSVMGYACHVSIFANDGTVTVHTTGVEMGQGLYMKVAQAAAYKLGCPLEYIRVKPTSQNVTPNGVLTGGSIASERCVAAVLDACETINKAIQPVKDAFPDADWRTMIFNSQFTAPLLSGEAQHVHTAGAPPLRYSSFMTGVVETEVDVLTGESQVKRVDMMADFGESMNPTIDIGQVEGAFVMGLGAYLSEDLFYDPETGKLLNDGTWEYKPPTTKDIPIDWRIHFLPDTPNPVGILSSKAVGEPPIGLAMGAILAIKQGIESAREDLTGEKVFVPVSAPFTVEKIQMGAGIQVGHLHV